MQGYECPRVFTGQGGGEVDGPGLYTEFLDEGGNIIDAGFQHEAADPGWQLGDGFSQGYRDKREDEHTDTRCC